LALLSACCPYFVLPTRVVSHHGATDKKAQGKRCKVSSARQFEAQKLDNDERGSSSGMEPLLLHLSSQSHGVFPSTSGLACVEDSDVTRG